MANVRDTIAYICKNYPHKGELSKARVAKMVYLADWRSAIVRGEQLTPIEWIFNHYGPYVPDVVNAALEDDALSVTSTRNFYGGDKELIRAEDDITYPSVSDEDQQILDFMIDATKRMYWDDFMSFVYSTYPIATQDRYSKLDLVDLAKEYKGVTELMVP